MREGNEKLKEFFFWSIDRESSSRCCCRPSRLSFFLVLFQSDFTVREGERRAAQKQQHRNELIYREITGAEKAILNAAASDSSSSSSSNDNSRRGASSHGPSGHTSSTSTSSSTDPPRPRPRRGHCPVDRHGKGLVVRRARRLSDESMNPPLMRIGCLDDGDGRGRGGNRAALIRVVVVFVAALDVVVAVGVERRGDVARAPDGGR